MSPQEELDFEVIGMLMRDGYLPNSYHPIHILKETLKPIIWEQTYEVLEGMCHRHLIGKDHINSYSLLQSAINWRQSVIRDRQAQRASTRLKYMVGVIGIIGVISTAILSIAQLQQGAEQRSLRQELKTATNQKDSVQELLKGLQQKQQSQPPQLPDTTTKRK